MVAVGNYALIAGQDARVDVLVLTRDVSWGQQIGEGDLGVAKAVPGQPLASIPASERAGVVGQVARSTLPAGSVLAPGQLSAQPVPGPGERLVGLPVRPGHLPARGLAAGDLVQVSPVATGTGTDTGLAPAAVEPFRARVLGVGLPDSSGVVTVDVVVGADAAAAATSAAAGQVVLVQLGPGA
ncbi:SAF domain-containing protein [Amycolatopsis saalfeldensis]|uniref:SAF domain-containing protein n=1 Tax=Amycolatopsis saalfeldensis TaxID=394193 RepID=A0A1H8YPL2_9PSEU|nr:SAF domain-containing protein [Amycolatopsis saalfeldensis]